VTRLATPVIGTTIRGIGGEFYLRPDIGGALLPYVYTIIVIIVHLPVVVIQVVRWQKAQTWCLVATVLTLVITIQGFILTQFAPEKLLTWTPLLLIIDAGSKAQVLFLIIEDRNLLSRLRKALPRSKEAENVVLLEDPPSERQCGGEYLAVRWSEFVLLTPQDCVNLKTSNSTKLQSLKRSMSTTHIAGLLATARISPTYDFWKMTPSTWPS